MAAAVPRSMPALPDDAIERLCAGRHDDPFSLLGRHRLADACAQLP